MSELPKIWDEWLKNITYIPKERFSETMRFISENINRLSDWAVMEYMVLMAQAEMGIQYVVEKSASDDLLMTDTDNVSFEDLPWPSRSLEVYFEDPKIPTIIIQNRDVEMFQRELDRLPGPAGYFKARGEAGPHTRVLTQNRKGEILQVNLTPQDMDDYARNKIKIGATDNTDRPNAARVLSLESEEDEGLRRLTLLAYKVIIYSSIPELRPREVSRKSLRFGGKSGVKGRPILPLYRVVNVPVQYRESQRKTEESKTSKEFNGRRGHFHHYRSEKFVNRKGTFDYYPPIYNKEGKIPKTILKVRK